MEEIRTHLKQYLIGMLSGALASLLFQTCLELVPLFQTICKALSKALFGKIILLLLLILLYLCARIYLLKKLNLKFGIYWDRKKSPYCPVCKMPLTSYTRTIGGSEHFAHCLKCRDQVFFHDDDGKTISLEDCRKHL